MSSLMVWMFAVAFGFVTAGVIGSTYQLLTNQPISFSLLDGGGMGAILMVTLLVFAGPAIIMRNALRGRIIEKRAPHWLAMSTALAGLWSFMEGVFILHIFIATQSGALA